jgi:hypothetical protein
MSKKSRQHTSDEFGKSSGSSGQFIGLDPPMIGAASSILIDGITERESGVTPPPPPISVRTFVIIFAVMFVIGVVGTIVLIQLTPQVPTPFGL